MLRKRVGSSGTETNTQSASVVAAVSLQQYQQSTHTSTRAIYGDTSDCVSRSLFRSCLAQTIHAGGLRVVGIPNLVSNAVCNGYDGRLSGLCYENSICFGEQL